MTESKDNRPADDATEAAGAAADADTRAADASSGGASLGDASSEDAQTADASLDDVRLDEASADDGREPRSSARAAGGGAFPGGVVPTFALILGVVATAVAGFLLWQYRQFYVALDDADAQMVVGLEESRADQRRLADQIDELRAELAASRADAERLRAELDVLPAEIGALGRRIETIQGGRLDVADAWLRAQAEYYLVVANTELNVAGNWGSAISALELADELLRDLGDPSLGDVRAAIRSELQALRAVALPDIEGMALDLGSLIDRIDRMPMRADNPEIYSAGDEALDDAEPGFGRLWLRLRGALSSIVRVERRDQPAEQILTESERRVVRRQLALELSIARAAVLAVRQADFRASLAAADDILSRDFNGTAASVVEARRLLDDMSRAELMPPKPDISDSLMLFRAASGTN